MSWWRQIVFVHAEAGTPLFIFAIFASKIVWQRASSLWPLENLFSLHSAPHSQLIIVRMVIVGWNVKISFKCKQRRLNQLLLLPYGFLWLARTAIAFECCSRGALLFSLRSKYLHCVSGGIRFQINIHLSVFVMPLTVCATRSAVVASHYMKMHIQFAFFYETTHANAMVNGLWSRHACDSGGNMHGSCERKSCERVAIAIPIDCFE